MFVEKLICIFEDKEELNKYTKSVIGKGIDIEDIQEVTVIYNDVTKENELLFTYMYHYSSVMKRNGVLNKTEEKSVNYLRFNDYGCTYSFSSNIDKDSLTKAHRKFIAGIFKDLYIDTLRKHLEEKANIEIEEEITDITS